MSNLCGDFELILDSTHYQHSIRTPTIPLSRHSQPGDRHSPAEQPAAGDPDPGTDQDEDPPDSATVQPDHGQPEHPGDLHLQPQGVIDGYEPEAAPERDSLETERGLTGLD